MIKKKLAYILIFFFISSCGYVSIYDNSENFNYIININQTEGDQDINNLYKDLSNRMKGKNYQNEITIDIKTNYTKTIIGKDLKGSASDYKLLVETEFLLLSGKENRKIFLAEDFIIKRSGKNFEQQNYEKTVKQNLAKTIFQNFLRNLSLQ